jgi:hypothetical protein
MKEKILNYEMCWVLEAMAERGGAMCGNVA